VGFRKLGQIAALPGPALIEVGGGFGSELIEVEEFVGGGFFGGDEERDFAVDVEEGFEGFERRGARGFGDEAQNHRKVGFETRELHFLVAAGA